MTAHNDRYAHIRALSRASGGGIYLGSGENDFVSAPPERSVLVLGPPRSGKTSCIVIPSILSALGPVVSTSTKPEVMIRTAPARSRAGELMLYDPTGTVDRPAHVAPLTWSPVSACAQWSEAMLMSKLMVSASTASSSSSNVSRTLDDHWHERAHSLIATLLHAASIDDEPMSTVLKWIDRHQPDPALSILKDAGSEYARGLLDGIDRTDEREQSGIWSTASGVLNAYRSDAAIATTTGEPFSARDWAEGSGTIYICASARHQSLASPLVVGLLSEIRTACYEHAASDQSAPPMLFALDEAANIAPLADLPQQLSEGGGQGLLTLVCLQDMSQARARWGPEADGWFSLFGSKLILPGIMDVRTLEMISKLAGDREISRTSHSVPVSEPGDVARSVIFRLAGDRGSVGPPRSGPSLTTSTTHEPWLPVAAISKGKEGHALLLDERAGFYGVKLTPWYREPFLSVVEPEIGLSREPPPSGLPRPDLGIGL